METTTPAAELEALAAEAKTLPARRHAAVEAARNAGMTWREIAAHLHMTEQGVLKAHKKEAGK